ncbi:hypothetical protein N6G96_07235 [Pediococcus inopinatus]|uniref:Mobilization protein n=1 Tax=Pediococcus inopinatus TaxID=114090 RepID=A0ABZ0Q2A4_9LACO|nr:hypothetical protein [Pediococcus inopinatus]WPC19293.1 hypothetical protein N6G95_08660 [Pediococcus inopinatus]WPC21083.1 hypothetical protein N6G96_07235 [Pediococcus inopinatus]
MNIETQLAKAKEKVAELETKRKKLQTKNYERIGVLVCKQLNLDPFDLKESLAKIKQINESNEEKNRGTEN